MATLSLDVGELLEFIIEWPMAFLEDFPECIDFNAADFGWRVVPRSELLIALHDPM